MTALRLGLVAVAALAAVAIGILVGGVPLGPADVARALAHPAGRDDAAVIVWTLRLPRVCVAAVVGGALAIAGFLLQGMLRNPLVDPFLPA